MTTRDQDGRRVVRLVARERNGLWGANVWWGGAGNFASTLRRHYYATRAEARDADISDDAPIGIGEYRDSMAD